MEKKPDKFVYLKLIGLLTIPLFLLFLYAVSDKELTVGEFTLRKVDLKKHFQKHTDKDQTVEDTIKVVATPVDSIVNDTTSQCILLFGDSMVEGLSKRLRQYAAKNNHELLSVIWYSSSTKLWSQTDTLAHFMRQFQPTYVMISLGGNELFINQPEKREVYIQDILNKVDTLPYIWIGPPNWKEDTGINKVIEKNTGTHRFFPSKKLTFERTSDGAHPTLASSAKWMDSVAVWMNEETNYRIKMEFPAPSEEKHGRTVLLQPLK